MDELDVLKNNVRIAALWLDHAYPGWVAKMPADLSEIAMFAGRQCVGSRVSERFPDGWVAVSDEFTAAFPDYDLGASPWAQGDQFWREEITLRRQAAGLSAEISLAPVVSDPDTGLGFCIFGVETVAYNSDLGPVLKDKDGDKVRIDLDALQAVIDQLRS